MADVSISISLAREVKEYAKQIGLDLCGIASSVELDALGTVYIPLLRHDTVNCADVLPGARSVIICGAHVWDDVLEAEVRKGTALRWPGYDYVACRAEIMARLLESRGYKAKTRVQVSLKRAARLCGLGQWGKNALIVTPEFGPWCRFAPVITDANLAPDGPFEEDLCGQCDACVAACPRGALSPYVVDGFKCLVGISQIACYETAVPADIRAEYSPQVTASAHLMCTACQKACRYGPRRP